MSREWVYLIVGVVVGLLPFCAYVVYKKWSVGEIHPNQKIIYKTVANAELSLHVFNAADKQSKGPFPALILFHGGAWQFGGPQAFYRHCHYFSRMGISCISVQYRIESVYGTNPAAAVQDARSAYAYVLQQAAKLNIDPARIAVGGGSSGGHLAATLGVPIPLPEEDSGFSQLPRPKALVLFNPMLDLSPCHPDHHLVADYWHDVSPMHHVDGQVPPTLILLGTNDHEVPVATAKQFCDAMTKQNNRCELALYEGARHGFFNYEVANGRYFYETNQRIVDFLGAFGWFGQERD